jgi:hypothetical protein
MTFKILTPKNKVIFWSVIRSALDHAQRHRRLAPLGGEFGELNHAGDKVLFAPTLIHSIVMIRRRVTINPEKRIGRTFLKGTEADGQRFRSRVVRAIVDKDNELKKDPQHIKFLCLVDGDAADKIFSYNQILDYI